MKSTMRTYSITLLFILTVKLFAQDAIKPPEDIYGLDPLLYNGKKYSYFLPPSASGHQYLNSTDFQPGTVTIKDKTFKNLFLNYDIYNQELLLKYEDGMGSISIIELSKAWLESFLIGEKHFICLDTPKGAKLYQVCGAGHARFLFYWKKEFKVEQGNRAIHYIFGDPRRTSFLMLDGHIMPFRGNRALLKLFSPEDQEALKAYLKKNHIKVKSASDREMEALAAFIDENIK